VKVNAALNEVMKRRTTFVIAHRLATVRNATRILVLDHGCIVKSGTFDEWAREVFWPPWPKRNSSPASLGELGLTTG
jgi:ABC-type multidrug transport system fused ATPase/permease subunit